MTSLQANGQVDAVGMWFEVVNHTTLDVVLDRIVFSLWAGQPVLHGVMANRTPIPRNETVSDILFEGMLTPSGVEMIEKRKAEVRNGGHGQYSVHGTAYFDSSQGPFAVRLLKMQRDIPPV